MPLVFLTDGRDLRRYALHALDEGGRRGQITHLSAHPIGVRAFVQAGLALTVMPLSTVVQPLQIAPEALSLPQLSPIALAGYRSELAASSETDLLLNLLEQASKL